MKKTKLFTSLVALALVLGLGACDLTEETPDESDKTTETGETSESTEPSESSESSETGDTSESSETGDTGETTPGGDTGVSTLSNYTLSIGISYNGDLVTVPEYATAYIEGGWDNWTEWVSLTESVDGRYEYTFASIAPGTYEYQLVLAYNDKEPGWTNRITPDGGNASFTVTASDGDYYTNEVTVTASKALTDIIPDPSASYSNVKVTIDITYGGNSQGVLDYGTLWIEGSWNWNAGFVPCEKEGDKYVYTFDSLAPIEYEFLGVIYYTGESLPTEDEGLWDYKVNNANCTFTVDDTEVTAKLVATQPLANILPAKGGDDDENVIPGTDYVIGESYWLGYNMSNVDYYFDGTVYNTYYGGATSDTSDAAWVTVDEYNDGYSLSFVDANGKTQYIYMAESGSNRNFQWREQPYAWSYDLDYDTFVAYDSNNTLYFIGTYGTHKDFCCNAYGFLTGEKETTNAQYPAHLYEIKAPTTLSISGADTLSVDLSTQLTVTANAGAYPGATWSSSNNAIATVSETGLVTGVAEGEVTIYATSTLDPTIIGSHQMKIEAKAEGSRTLNYSYTFASGNGITTSGGTVTLGGLQWTTTAAIYIGGEYSGSSRGLQIGSSNSPQTTPWTISTNFGEDVTLRSVAINVVGASNSKGANFTITHGSTTVANAVSFSTTAKDYEYTNLDVTGDSLSISMVCTEKGMYLKYISFSIEVGPESTLNW